MDKSPGSSTASPELDGVSHVNVSHGKMCEVVSHCGLKEHFPNE